MSAIKNRKNRSSILVSFGMVVGALLVGYLPSGGASAAVAPVVTSVLPAQGAAATVTWALADKTDLVGYAVTASIGGTTIKTVPATPAVSSATVTDLSYGQTYLFRVAALFADETKQVSTAFSYTVKGAPGAPVVQVLSGDGSLTVSWNEPANNGSAILSYTVSHTPNAVLDDVQIVNDGTGSSRTYEYTGLNNNGVYEVVVTATNALGSTSSAPVSVSPCAGDEAISPPDSLVVLGVGDGSVTLGWVAPDNAGCGALLGFSVSVERNGAALNPDIVGGDDIADDTTTTVTGLANGVVHTFTVRATNTGQQTSDDSNEVSATPLSSAVGPGGGGSSGTFGARIGGATRFDTAAQLSREFFAPGVSVVYLASGLGFADALAGGPAADKGDGPILLVQPDSIPASTSTELGRLRPARIVILGGVDVVSTAVENEAKQFTSGTVTRIGGRDRFETAALVSSVTFEPNVPAVYLATGANFADALAAGPVAEGKAPILLVKSDSIPEATRRELSRLRPQKIVILGGVEAITASVQADADQFTTGAITRIGGANRYETAALVSAQHFTKGVGTIFLATGSSFADALAAAPLGSPILLVEQTCIPKRAFREFARLGAGRTIVLGGPNAVSDRVRQLRSCLDS